VLYLEAMTYKDDRRYETYEMRAAYDDRYVVDSRRITSKKAREAALREADHYYVLAGEARVEARKHERHTSEWDAAVATFERYTELRREIHDRIAAYDRSKES
jgi:hypothetical protein